MRGGKLAGRDSFALPSAGEDGFDPSAAHPCKSLVLRNTILLTFVCESDLLSQSSESDVDEKRDDNNLGTIVMFRTVYDLRYHYTRNLEKEARGVDKLRAVERRSRSGSEVSARECAAARFHTSNL